MIFVLHVRAKRSNGDADEGFDGTRKTLKTRKMKLLINLCAEYEKGKNYKDMQVAGKNYLWTLIYITQ